MDICNCPWPVRLCTVSCPGSIHCHCHFESGVFWNVPEKGEPQVEFGEIDCHQWGSSVNRISPSINRILLVTITRRPYERFFGSGVSSVGISEDIVWGGEIRFF